MTAHDRDAPPPRLDRLEQELASLQDQVASLSARLDAALPTDPAPPAPGRALPEEFWALDELRRRVPAPGGVVYAGAVDVGPGHVEYQWGRPTSELLRADWADRADRLSALGNPLRLAMLRLLLDGERTVAQLVDELALASTGIAYHHLHQLQGGGWATSPQRGLWSIPPSRVIPLLTVITALEEA